MRMALVMSEDAIFFDQRSTRPTAVFRTGRKCIGQIAPVDQILADRMGPVRTRIPWGKGLVEEVPTSLPATQAIGIVETPIGIGEVVARTKWIVAASLARRAKCL